MFLRESTQKRAGGATVTHLQLAESVWNPTTQRADTRIVYNFGRADDPQVRERLRTLARSILRRVAPGGDRRRIAPTGRCWTPGPTATSMSWSSCGSGSGCRSGCRP